VMQGNFWWAWEVPEPPATDTGYYPWGKLAEGVLQIWQ